MAFSTPLLISLAVIVVPLCLYVPVRWLLSTRRPLGYPPGPPTRLGWGNLHQIPQFFSFTQLDQWAKEYGPVLGLKLGARNVVLLNDASLVTDLIVKRAASFSARPPMYIAQEHVLHGTGHAYSLFLRNDCSSRLRTMTKQHLGGTGLVKLAPVQKAAGTHLMYNLLHSGDQWMGHFMQWGLSAPVSILTGLPIQDVGENWIRDYGISQHLINELLDPTNSPPVEFFPVFRWVPARFAEWKRKAPIARKALLHAYEGIITCAKTDQQSLFQPIIPKMLKQASDPSAPPEERYSELEMKVMIGGLLDASVGSTIMASQNILFALAAHPDVQRKAQAEIDSVFADDEAMPDNIDLDRLPYLTACIYETLRWRPLGAYPLGPFGLPRETVEDVNVLGHRIPKGTTVLINQWTIAQDSDFYDEPDRFMPERFMRNPAGVKDGVSPAGRKPVYTFGAGRRECLGKDMFYQNTKIVFAQMLWAFDIVPAEPLQIDAKAGFTPAVMMMPKPFKVRFEPRRKGLAESLEMEKQKADATLSEILA